MIKFEKFFTPLFFIIFILIWQAVVLLLNYPSFILPTPQQVFLRFYQVLLNGTLTYHSLITLKEIILGLSLGLSLAFFLAYLFSQFKLLNKLLAPYLVGLQSIPILALAPLLIIWFGAGIFSKIAVCAATLFFPVFINTLTGFNNIDKNFQHLLTSLNASKWQKLKYLEIPSSLPILFSGLKIGVTLSVIGAVVGEFVGADRGLGFLINLASGLYDTPLRFAAFFTLSFIAISLYQMVNFLEKRVIKWKG